MKILVVDDESIIRDSLCHVIRHSSLGISEILSTSDPAQAKEILKQENPEILLTDIRMPQITGLDLAQFVQDEKLTVKIIFITGYSDFEYARAGIQYHISDYLLKPVDKTEAIDCIRNVMQSLVREQKHAEMYKLFQNYFSTHFETARRHFLEHLLFYPMTYTTQELALQQKEMRLDCDEFCLGAVTFESSIPSMAEDSYYIYMIEQYLNNHYSDIITLPSGNILYLFCPIPNEFYDKTNGLIISSVNKLLTDLETQYPILISLGFSRKADKLDHMQLLRRQVAQSLKYALAHSSHRIVFYEDFAQTRADEQYFDISYLITDLVNCLRIGDRGNIDRILTPLIEQIKMQDIVIVENTLQLLVSHILYLVNGLALAPAELSHIQTTVETHLHAQSNLNIKLDYLQYWISYICDCVQGLQSNEQNSLISGVYDYINRYYANPIGLTDVSEYINRNPSYVSRLIKQCTNHNFSNILTEKRIEEAKKLLKDPSLKLADIALQTGYPNLRYFTRVFHTQVNMSPNDYRKIICAFQ